MKSEALKIIADKILESRKPLIVMPKNPNPDTVGASLGLFLALKKMNKDVRIACESRISKRYRYLSQFEAITREIPNNVEYCISFDLEDEKIKVLSAERKGRTVEIKLQSEKSKIPLETMKIDRKNAGYDKIILISASGYNSLGKITKESEELLENSEIICIGKSDTDNILDNDAYFENAPISEIIFSLLEELGYKNDDFEISTALLSGIIAGTRNFQAKRISHGTFEVTSRLISSGADRDQIAKYLKRSNLPIFAIEWVDNVIANWGKFDNYAQIYQNFEKFAKAKRLSAYEKAIVFAVIAIFATQNFKGSGSGESNDKGNNFLRLPERNVVYAIEKLPISDEAEKIEKNLIGDTIANEQDEQNSAYREVNVGNPKTLSIKKLGVNANIQYVGLNDDGSVEDPTNEKEAGWYKFGSRPGEEGNAVLLGHRDSKTNPNGVFRRLNDLKISDLIEVTDDNGNIYKYKVTKKAIYGDTDAPMSEIFGSTDKFRLNLITCIGDWNEKESNYNKRVVIFSEMIK